MQFLRGEKYDILKFEVQTIVTFCVLSVHYKTIVFYVEKESTADGAGIQYMVIEPPGYRTAQRQVL
jgi:hypothetical protein